VQPHACEKGEDTKGPGPLAEPELRGLEQLLQSLFL